MVEASVYIFLLLSTASPLQVTNERVEAAIARFQTILFKPLGEKAHWDSHDIPPPTASTQWGGHTALATLALVLSGNSPQRPELSRAIHWLDKTPLLGTYAAAMRNHVWAQLPDTYLPRLEQDTRWLLNASDEAGRYGYSYPADRWDNSNTQYAVLGLWEALKRGVHVPVARWRQIEDHFIVTQKEDGGWGYTLGDKSYGSMTCAGLTGLLVAQQVLYRARDKPEPRISRAIQRGLDWMDKHFDGSSNPKKGAHTYYYCYGVERVGLASGHRFFNDKDWFTSITSDLIGRHAPSSSLVSASFALMFLSRGYVPVWITKLQVPDTQAWNHRPNDLYFFNQWLANQRETDQNWQTINLDRSAEDLMSAPLAWLSSDEPIAFTAAHKATLKRYLDLGGTLVVNPENGSKSLPFQNVIRKLIRELYPQRSLKRMPKNHPIFNVLHPVRPRPIQHLHNGVRDLLVMPESDWGMRFQKPGQAHRDEFLLMANLFALTTDRGLLPKRLEPHFERHQMRSPSDRMVIGRAAYDGNWLPEPGGWEQLANHFFNRTEIELLLTAEGDAVAEPSGGISQPDNAVPGKAPDQIPDHQQVCHLSNIAGSDIPLIHLAGVDEVVLNDPQLKAIDEFVHGGGTVFVETVGGLGHFAAGVSRQLQDLLQKPLLPLAEEDSIITGVGLKHGYDNRRLNYRRTSLIKLLGSHEPRLMAILVEDRPAIIVSHEDLTLGAMGVQRSNILGYTKQSATQLLTNLILSARKHCQGKQSKPK